MVIQSPNYEIGKEYSWGRCVSNDELHMLERRNVDMEQKFKPTKTHTPVNSWRVCCMMYDTFTSKFEMSEPRHLVSNDEATILSWFNIGVPGFIDSQVQHQVVAINNHTKKRSFTCLTGEEVGLCTNGMIWAEHVSKRRHTQNIWEDLDYFLFQARSNVINSITDMNDTLHKWKESEELSTKQVNDFLVRAYEAGCMTAQDFPKVNNHIKRPEHPEFGRHNYYNILQGFTSTWRETNPQTLSLKCKKIRNFIGNEYADSISNG